MVPSAALLPEIVATLITAGPPSHWPCSPNATFWWANSALAIDQVSAKFIGVSGAGKTVMSGASVEFACTAAWTPVPLSGGAHPCIVVEVEGLNCPLIERFRPDLDAQVGQRNLIFATAGGVQPFSLMVFNPFSQEAETAVHARTMRISGAHLRDLPLQVLLDAALPERRIALRDSGVIVADLDAREFLRPVEIREAERHGGHDAARLRPPMGYRGRDLAGPPLFELSLPAGGSAEIVFENRAGQLGRDDMLIHQISQVSAGFIVGGYTLVQR
jgi:hypothetical protein